MAPPLAIHALRHVAASLLIERTALCDHRQHDHVLAHRTLRQAAVCVLRRLAYLRDNTQRLSLAAQRNLKVEGKLENREVGMKRTSNSDQTYSAEPRYVQGGFQPIGHKGREGKIDGLPVGPCGEMSPVGLPGPGII